MEFAQLDKQRFLKFKEFGFHPKCIFDIGSSNGEWTRHMLEVFPDARCHLFDPLSELHEPYTERLSKLTSRQKEVHVHPIALGEACGTTQFGKSKDIYGSSTLIKKTDAYFPEVLSVPVSTLDAYIEREKLPKPQLLKLDTQGSELLILKGAVETLKTVDIILLETWFVRCYGESNPVFMEVANWLATQNFYLLDIGDCYRDDKGMMVAPDFFFVRLPSPMQAFNGSRVFQVPPQES